MLTKGVETQMEGGTTTK